MTAAQNTMGRGFALLPVGLKALICLSLFSAMPTALRAQQNGETDVPPEVSVEEFQAFSTLLTIERDQLYRRSQLGIALEAMLTGERDALQTENQQIFDALTAEENELVTLRGQTEAESFSVLASAFDEKVQRIRQEQDLKLRTLVRRREEILNRFVTISLPLVAQVARDRGGLAVIERSQVFLVVQDIDITTDAIALIDQVYSGGNIPNMFLQVIPLETTEN
ncbi:OmpH family outer membrane protein [Halocynthiibacter styelae]|uniref:OmpH family outer membrane protein n=1 Tax=Halocynthiibacter styelae TaxID=2761955 RepID=A0A8J7LTX6_9RHOB|nr:OmpH family outer membrane protein [Paenihalocynthiibacter styelae]MBI1492322.1 OmpH family outer membrane protein [Paenihalocynthiibacter styelae]